MNPARRRIPTPAAVDELAAAFHAAGWIDDSSPVVDGWREMAARRHSRRPA